jgi:hypothetical protein
MKMKQCKCLGNSIYNRKAKGGQRPPFILLTMDQSRHKVEKQTDATRRQVFLDQAKAAEKGDNIMIPRASKFSL